MKYFLENINKMTSTETVQDILKEICEVLGASNYKATLEKHAKEPEYLYEYAVHIRGLQDIIPHGIEPKAWLELLQKFSSRLEVEYPEVVEARRRKWNKSR